MEAKAYLRNVRISPRKVQIVLNLIRGKDVKVAQAILEQTPKSASEYLLDRKSVGRERVFRTVYI